MVLSSFFPPLEWRRRLIPPPSPFSGADHNQNNLLINAVETCYALHRLKNAGDRRVLETVVIYDHTGKPTGVVMSFEKFLELAPLDAEAYLSDEDLADRVLSAHDPTEEVWPHHVVERLVLGDEAPLKILREYLNLTRKDLAKMAGCSVEDISRLESGHKAMSRSLKRLLAGILDVDVEDLSPASSPT